MYDPIFSFLNYFRNESESPSITIGNWQAHVACLFATQIQQPFFPGSTKSPRRLLKLNAYTRIYIPIAVAHTRHSIVYIDFDAEGSAAALDRTPHGGCFSI